MGLFKRSREEYGSDRVIDHIKMANYLMFLSRGLNVGDFTPSVTTTTTSHQYYSSTNRVFECKTCSRQFPSFQALGGHRASHKRPRLMSTITNSLSSGHGSEGTSSSPPKPKTHECSICGLEFGIGQALGGHMRRHRAANNASNTTDTSTETLPLVNTTTTNTTSTMMSSNKVNMCLDLNLTPLENDNLEFRLGGKKMVQIASMVG